MKKIQYILFALTLITFSACTPEEETFEDLIIGTWQLTHIKGNSNIGCQNQTTISFDGVEAEKIEYEDNPSGNCVIYLQVTSLYSIDNDVITFISGSNSSTADILQLDNTTLKLDQHIGGGTISITLVRQ